MGTLRKYTRNVRNDPEYVVWKGLRARVGNPNHTSYHRYGARGLEVAVEFDNYEVFLADVGRRPDKGYWIERVDNTKGYIPGNLKWATPKDQCRNTRRNKQVTLNGITKSLVEWCEALEVPYSTIRSRLSNGWSDSKALTTPVRSGNYKRKQNAHHQ